jgi:hypothetical protein
VLTHGVGPMRRYAIGALLLDLDDPQRVLGHLREPLIEPDDGRARGIWFQTWCTRAAPSCTPISSSCLTVFSDLRRGRGARGLSELVDALTSSDSAVNR